MLNIFDRYIPELIKDKAYSKLTKLITLSFIVSFLIFIGLSIGTYILNDKIGLFFKLPDFKSYLFVFLFLILSSFLGGMLDTICKAALLHRGVSLIAVSNSVVRLILYISLLPQLNIRNLLIIESILFLLFSI